MFYAQLPNLWTKPSQFSLLCDPLQDRRNVMNRTGDRGSLCSGGPQSIPATNPPCPNSRSSSPLSPPYIPPAPTTAHFLLSHHQGRWYLPSASPSSAWPSLLVSTKRFDNCCHNGHPAPCGPLLRSAALFEMFGPAESDWCLHNQLVISWQPSVRQHNNKVDDWMSTRVSGCQVCAYGHPLYLTKVFVWSTRDLLPSKLKLFLHTHSTTSHTKHRWRKSTQVAFITFLYAPVIPWLLPHTFPFFPVNFSYAPQCTRHFWSVENSTSHF